MTADDWQPRGHTPWSEAQDAVAPGHAVVFWRPGCGYCERLLRTARQDRRITWVNIWEDDDAAAAVRELNNGNEYVPTALVGDAVLRNPSGGKLLAALDGDA